MKYITLTQSKVAIVDDNMFEPLNQYKWYASKHTNTFYVRRSATIDGKSVKIYMHKVVLPGIELVDHINGNGLDNRRENLRPATGTQNNANRIKGKGTSKYKGVYWDKSRSNWVASIKINKHPKNLGRFNSEIDAAKTYNEAAIKYFGEYAKLNNI